MALAPGQQVPDFELRDQHGQSLALSSFRGLKPVVVVFYPFAFSRVCTGELSELRDQEERALGADAQLVAISCDPMYSLRAFAEHQRLDFPLLSDFWPHGQVSRSFGVFDEERGCSRRSTFIVDVSGTLRWSIHNATSQARRVDDYRTVLAGLPAGPAEARPGANRTLK